MKDKEPKKIPDVQNAKPDKAPEVANEQLDEVSGGIQAGFVTIGGHGEWGYQPPEPPTTPPHHYL